MRYLLACCTDIGKRKTVNQDSLLVSQAKYQGQEVVLAVICDGMGGLKQGEVASAEVIYSFSQWFKKIFPLLAKEKEFEDELYDSWEKLLQNVHQKIRKYGQLYGIRIGTTVTAMLLWQEGYYIAHVGDCRIYEIKEGIAQLTKDQIQAKLSAGNDRETGKSDPNGKVFKGENILLQGVGVSEMIRPAYYSGVVKEDAVYLLCTDGFRHKISRQELQQAFVPENLTDEENMRKQGEKMIKTVMKRGEKDNISVILLHTLSNQRDYKKRSDKYTEEFMIDRENMLLGG